MLLIAREDAIHGLKPKLAPLRIQGNRAHILPSLAEVITSQDV
jgi:hypothetical protein